MTRGTRAQPAHPCSSPLGMAILVLAGLGGVTLGALCCLVVLPPIVRYLAADR